MTTEERQKILPGALEALLVSDNIALPGSGAERSIKCFNPHHDDDNPSMSVNIVKGTYYCHACDVRGNAWSYLTEIRKYSAVAARQLLIGLGWIGEQFELAKKETKAKVDRKAGLATHCNTPYPFSFNRDRTRRAKCIAKHEYRSADGRLICLRQRYEKVKGCAKILSFTPSSGGGWWVTMPHKDSIPEADRWLHKLPLYRLPDLLKMMERQGPDRPVWMGEGEKKVDAILSMSDAPTGCVFPTTSCFGSKISDQDFEVIKGRNVLVFGDTDLKGRKFAQAVGRELTNKWNCTVQLVLPEGDGGYDVADAIAEGGYKGMIEWVNEVGVTPYKDVAAKSARADMEETLAAVEADVDAGTLGDTEYYSVLGIADGAILFRKNATHEILPIPIKSLTGEMNFLEIAPLEFWHNLAKPKSFGRTTRLVFADILLRCAEDKGLIDISKVILGKGAFRQGDKYFFQHRPRCSSSGGGREADSPTRIRRDFPSAPSRLGNLVQIA